MLIQHYEFNVFILSLSLFFCFQLKGMTADKAEEEITNMVEKLKLEDKRDAKVIYYFYI